MNREHKLGYCGHLYDYLQFGTVAEMGLFVVFDDNCSGENVLSRAILWFDKFLYGECGKTCLTLNLYHT